MAVKGIRKSCRLVDNVANMYVLNNKSLMINFKINPTKVGGSISNNISSNRRKFKIRLALKNGTKRLVLTLTNVFYLFYSPSNLISLGFINSVRIFHHNEDQILYNQETQKVFAFTKYYDTSFLLYPLDLLIVVVSFFKYDNIYKNKKLNIY